MTTQCRHVIVQTGLTCEECGYDWDSPSIIVHYEGTAPTVAEIANHISNALVEEECWNCKWNGGR